MKTKYLFFLLTALTLNGTAALGQTVEYAFSNFAGMLGEQGNVDGTGIAARFDRPRGVSVPVPASRKLHWLYAPMFPAPAANMASDTRARSLSGTNTTTFACRAPSRLRRKTLEVHRVRNPAGWVGFWQGVILHPLLASRSR